MRPFIKSYACRTAAVVSLLTTCMMSAQADTKCQCRFPSGGNRDLGTVECLNITGRHYLMRCEMSNNTPYWKRLQDEEGCSVAS